MRDALASLRAEGFKGKSFRLPAAAELLLFCLSKREVTKRKRHPAWRLLGILPNKSVSRGRAFRAGIVPARKGVAILGNARCAACRPRLTAAQGTPGRAAGHRGPHSVMKLKSQSHGKASLCSGSSEECALGARCSTRGPYGAAGGRRKARRVAGRDAGQFVVRAGDGMDAGVEATQERLPDALSTNPVAHPRTRRAGCPEGAPSGWPLFWLLFSGHPEKSDSPSEGGRKLLL